MPNTIISAVAALAAGVSAALASGAAFKDNAYDGAITGLTQAEASLHARQVFARSDRNQDGVMSADEFASLSIITAELAHLNGFIAIEGDDGARTIALPIKAPVALPRGERARVEAVARNAFYAAAGSDGKLTAAEFISAEMVKFTEADRNRNGRLAKSELAGFAMRQARLATGA